MNKEEIIHINKDEFYDIIKNNENVIIDFYSTECPPCEALAEKYIELSKRYGSKILFTKIFRQENKDLAMSLNVMSSPTLLFYKNGVEIGQRLLGYINKEDILKNIALMGVEIKEDIVSNEKIFDTIIIGSGPAGATASIYASRYNMSNVVIGGEIGGMVAKTHLVDNYPALPNIEGSELSQKLLQHFKKYDQCEHVMDVVKQIEKDDNGIFKIITDGNRHYKGKSLIIALGTEKRKAGIKGESEFSGKGISYCTICDGMFYQDKVVAVLGAGDAALTGALHLSDVSTDVYLIYRKEEFSAKDEALKEEVKKRHNIHLISSSNVLEIQGSNIVEEIILDKEYNGSNKLKIDGLFIEIGTIPNDALLEKLGIEKNDSGFIKIDQNCKTNLEGVYAAGDITTGFSDLKQIVVAEAMGAVSATSAKKYISQKK